LDEIEAAHQSVGGTGPGRRYATQQINQAYAVLLASQFQGFCRDLHTEAVDHLANPIAIADLRKIVENAFLIDRKLDKGNVNPGNIGADFARLGLRLWDGVKRLSKFTSKRQKKLEELNIWRNAIAHQDFDPTKLGGNTTLHLSAVKGWRRTCEQLAQAFDAVVRDHIIALVGQAPW
jgi:hypothetical protein